MSDAREPTTRTARRRRRRAQVGRRCGAVVCCLLISFLAAMPGAAADAPTTAAAGSKQPTATTIIVEGITPKAPGPKSTVEVRGTVLNVSAEPLEEVHVRLRFSANPLVTRTQLTQYAEGQLPARAFPVAATQQRVAVDLGPKESANWRIKIPTADLGLTQFGVYPLAIESLGGRLQSVGMARTFLPFVPEKRLQPEPTQVAWLWPIVDRPHRSTDQTFLDDKLAAEMAPEGRLGRLIAAAAETRAAGGAARLPLTYAVDPQLLEDAHIMTDGYEVRGNGEPRDESPVAARWLGELRSVTEGATTFALPYADPDMTALTHAGLDDNLTFAVTKGESLAEGILGHGVARDVAWPPGGMLDQDTLDNLVVAGTQTVILADTAVPPAHPLTYTPNAVTSVPTIGGAVRVAVADSELTEILGRDTWSQGNAALTEQRFLAETALITAELPHQQRSLLIAPPRRWNPHPSLASALLADTAEVPWLEPTSLSHLASSADKVPRQPLRYPRSARKQEVPASYLAQVQEMNGDVQRLTSIVTPRSSEFHLALLRTESSAWRGQRELRTAFRRAVRTALDDRLGQVKILSRGPRTLASTTGTVPVTIGNELVDHSVTVGLRVTPRNHARLEIGDYQEQVAVDAERKETIQVPMEARAIGNTIVELQLVTPQGTPYGEVVELTVRATGYGTVAVAITGGAFALLFLAFGVRVVRGALRGDDEPAEDDQSPPDSQPSQGDQLPRDGEPDRHVPDEPE